MKTFVINLERNPERLAAIGARLDGLGIAYERIRAIDGRAFGAEELKKHVRQFRWWCAFGVKATPAQVGCAMSHASIYRKMVEEEISAACIFEDDASLGSAAKRVIDGVAPFLETARPRVVLLSDHSRDKTSPLLTFDDIEARSGEDVRLEPRKGEWGAEAYCINLAAARRLIEYNTPIAVMCDEWARFRKEGVIELSGALPPVAVQNREAFASTIKEPKRKRSAGELALRAVGRTLDEVFSLCGRIVRR